MLMGDTAGVAPCVANMLNNLSDARTVFDLSKDKRPIARQQACVVLHHA